MILDILAFCIPAPVIAIVLYTLVPDLFLHHLGIGSYRRQYSPGVVLTFDDGPDPLYTPRLLDILKRHGLTAVFFLIGEKAEKHPELVRRIVAEGHQIGSHGYTHTLAWRMTPRRTFRDWNRSVKTLERISGRQIQWFRPPHGVFNLFLWLWGIHSGRQAILYNVKGYDWLAKHSPEQITSTVLKRARAGSIVLLHDSGGEDGAPENTLQAVEEICRRIPEDLKLPIVPLELPNWGFRRRMLFALWQRWESLYAWMFRVKRLNATNLFRLTKRRYDGPDLYTPDGVLAATKGDLVGEIHFESVRFQMQPASAQAIGLTALKRVKSSLASLAEYLHNNPEFHDIRVLFGITYLNRGAKNLGFRVQELPPSLSLKLTAFIQRLLLAVYHPLGRKHHHRDLGELPKLVWITKEELIARWLPPKTGVPAIAPHQSRTAEPRLSPHHPPTEAPEFTRTAALQFSQDIAANLPQSDTLQACRTKADADSPGAST